MAPREQGPANPEGALDGRPGKAGAPSTVGAVKRRLRMPPPVRRSVFVFTALLALVLAGAALAGNGGAPPPPPAPPHPPRDPGRPLPVLPPPRGGLLPLSAAPPL